MEKGRFITIEGINGSGITSVIRNLRKVYPDAVIVREPGTTYTGGELKRVLLNSREKLEKQTELFLFVASMIEASNKIVKPALHRGKLVIADRWYYSTKAYQEFAYGHAFFVERLLEMSDVCNPDINIILDLPFEVAMARRVRRGDNIESRGEDYLRRVHLYYQTECDGLIVDAEDSLSVVTEKVTQIIRMLDEERNSNV
jgi:dTMP kinase